MDRTNCLESAQTEITKESGAHKNETKKGFKIKRQNSYIMTHEMLMGLGCRIRTVETM